MRKHNGKVTDLGFGHLGNGIVVYDRTRERNGDYAMVAHITASRTIDYTKVSISDEQRALIEHFAKTEDPTISASQDAKVFRTRPQL